jgi:hypothetical protein
MFKLAILVAATVGFITASAEPTTARSVALSSPFTMDACGSCNWCLGGHEAPPGGNSIRSLHSWCMQLADCNGHPGCNVTLGPALDDAASARLRETIEDAIRGNTLAIVALAENPSVKWNENRSALQVEGECDASVVAHLPIRRALADELGLRSTNGDDD